MASASSTIDTMDPPYDAFLNRTTSGAGQLNTAIDPSSGLDAYGVNRDVVATSAGNFSDVWIKTSIKSTNYSPKLRGFMIDGQNGYIECMSLFVGTGGITGGSINIPDTTSANSWHVDAQGNMWAGAAAFSSAPVRITNYGFAVFNGMQSFGGDIQGGTILGTHIQGQTIDGGTINGTLITGATIRTND
jgi:hypothetical protein